MSKAAKNEKFMIMAFTEPYSEGKSFQTWPQHLTIIPWLRGYRHQTTTRIRDALTSVGPLEVVIDGEAMFGNGDVPVWTLHLDKALHFAHQLVLDAACKYDTELEDESYVGADFQPHISRKDGQPAHRVGEQLTLPTLSVVGKYMNHKTLFTNIDL